MYKNIHNLSSSKRILNRKLFAIKKSNNFVILQQNPDEIWLLLVLGIFCTAFAFFMGNWLMKFISPFTMNLNVNMEPIYAIIIALLIFHQSEVMSPVFYVGAAIIIGAVFVNAFIKTRKKKKKAMALNSDLLDDNQSLT